MSKIIVYQLLPRLWGNNCQQPVPDGTLARNGTGKFASIDDATLRYLKEMGVSHVWFTGVIRHATTEAFPGCAASDPGIVKGRAGSPYAIVDYYDVNPYLAGKPEERMPEFESLLKRTHEAGLKAIIDFVPNHVSRDYGKVGWVRKEAVPFGAGDDCTVHWRRENDFYYYPGQLLRLPVSSGSPYMEYPAKASGNCFSPTPSAGDWYETVRLNYCEEPTSTWEKMYEIVRFWCSKGVDGFRCDMVEMVPWQFLRWLVARIKKEFPNVLFIAETYRTELYLLYVGEVGFDYLYDKSGLYDVLRDVARGDSACRITWNWQTLGVLQPRMLNFLENHDEQRFASEFFAGDVRKCAAYLGVSLCFNSAPFLLYFGEEVGESGMEAEGFSGMDGRTTIFDWWSPSSLQRLRRHVHTGEGLTDSEKKSLGKHAELLRLAATPAVSEGINYDLCYCNLEAPGFDPDRHFVFLRSGGGETLLFFCNFAGTSAHVSVKVPQEAFRLPAPTGSGPGDKGLTVKVETAPFGLAVVSLSAPR